MGSKLHVNDYSQYGAWLKASIFKSSHTSHPPNFGKQSFFGSSSFGMKFEEKKIHQFHNLVQGTHSLVEKVPSTSINKSANIQEGAGTNSIPTQVRNDNPLMEHMVLHNSPQDTFQG